MGCNRDWVREIRHSLADNGNFAGTRFLPTSHKRDIAQELLESDTDYDLVDIADELGGDRG